MTVQQIDFLTPEKQREAGDRLAAPSLANLAETMPVAAAALDDAGDRLEASERPARYETT